MDNYPDDEYTDQEEFQDNYLDEQREKWDDEMGGNYPQASKSPSLFSLFKDVWRTPDSSKVANLDKTEIGDLGISVRDCQEIATLANLLGHKKFSVYFMDMAEITSATSMSKKGWFVEMFVTSKKFAHKGVLGGNLAKANQAKKAKWRIFSQQGQANPENIG